MTAIPMLVPRERETRFVLFDDVPWRYRVVFPIEPPRIGFVRPIPRRVEHERVECDLMSYVSPWLGRVRVFVAAEDRDRCLMILRSAESAFAFLDMVKRITEAR